MVLFRGAQCCLPSESDGTLLCRRATLLDDTDAAMEHSLQQARKSKQRAKEIHARCTAAVVCKMRHLPCLALCAVAPPYVLNGVV